MTLHRLLFSVLLILSSFTCLFSQHYALKTVKGGSVEITSCLDGKINYELISDYKPSVDSLMSPVLGHCAVFMDASRPESLLSNWVADVFVNEAIAIGWNVDMGLCNVGGLRSSMPKGDVTVGDIMSISPFENKLCLLSVRGADLQELLCQIAKSGGEGVSSSLRITIDSDGMLRNAFINGEKVRKNKVYNIVTIDYLADGNDGMRALEKAIKRIDTKFIMRDVLMNFIKREAERGGVIDSKIEGRIVVLP